MLDKQGYSDYLARKNSSEKIRKERVELLDRFENVIAQNGITDIADVGDAEIIELMRPWNISGRRNFLHNIAGFLKDYSAFAKKETSALAPLAAMIENYYKKSYEAYGKSAAETRRQAVLPAPVDFKVNPKHLREMTNEQFVAAFREWQQFVVRCYENIERVPFDWGYPDYQTTDGYYNRVIDILFALGLCGMYTTDGGISVDGAKFFGSPIVKRHKKIEQMITGFEQMGLFFEGFGKKAQNFRVFYPDNPNVAAVLCEYAALIGANHAEWEWGRHLNSLSYRYAEDPASQKYPAIFNAEMDYSSAQLREIQEWLYAEAEKCGFTIDTGGLPQGCLSYRKGSKEFLRVRQGHRKPNAGHFDHHESKIGTKVSFIHAFESAPVQMRELCNRFPNVFRLDDTGKCCHENKCMHRMNFALDGVSYKRCGLGNFFFEDISFDDVKAILEMFKIENKIKSLF